MLCTYHPILFTFDSLGYREGHVGGFPSEFKHRDARFYTCKRTRFLFPARQRALLT